MTAPGDLSSRLKLEAPIEAADGAGGMTRSYAVEATLWAQLIPLFARAATIADDAGGARRYRIIIRVRQGITTKHRFRDGERIFRILATQPTANRRFLDIEAEEQAD
jgi:SPP1 family predicted phage head-tail adaptor